MKISLFTVGFTGKSAEEFFGLLASAAVTKVVDVRESRIGQLSGFAKFLDIAYFLDRLLGLQHARARRWARACCGAERTLVSGAILEEGQRVMVGFGCKAPDYDEPVPLRTAAELMERLLPRAGIKAPVKDEGLREIEHAIDK